MSAVSLPPINPRQIKAIFPQPRNARICKVMLKNNSVLERPASELRGIQESFVRAHLEDANVGEEYMLEEVVKTHIRKVEGGMFIVVGYPSVKYSAKGLIDEYGLNWSSHPRAPEFNPPPLPDEPAGMSPGMSS